MSAKSCPARPHRWPHVRLRGVPEGSHRRL